MKLRNLTPVAAAVALAVGSLTVTTAAEAGVSGSIGVSNFYLWRGSDASGGVAQVSGEIKYTHSSGAYIAEWMSNTADDNENNFYAGYGLSAGSVDLDFSVWNITYPRKAYTTNKTIYQTNVTEFVASISASDFNTTWVFDIDPDSENKYKYISVGYGKDAYSATIGKWIGDEDKGMTTYGHVTLGYAISDELTFSVNKAFGGQPEEVNKELLTNIAWSKSFDVK